MKKVIFSLMALVCSMNMNAQIMKVMKGETVVATYTVNQADKVVFEETKTDTHEYVDLGLSVKWATCNIGATTPEEYGLYFAWGETVGHTQDTSDGRSFNWANYKWCNGTKDTLTKYCTRSNYGTVDNKTSLDPEDDAAQVNWGGTWRMPTKAEQDDLLNNCTWTWTTQNGVKGYKVVGKNGNSIFLPAAGERANYLLDKVGSEGYYWSSSNYSPDPYYGCELNFNSTYKNSEHDERRYGYSIRAVCP